MIEIVEHELNAIIREQNKVALAAGRNCQQLITDLEFIRYNGREIGVLKNHPKKQPGVNLFVTVDDEIRAEIDREVERHLGASCIVLQPPPDDDEPEEEETEDDDDES